MLPAAVLSYLSASTSACGLTCHPDVSTRATSLYPRHDGKAGWWPASDFQPDFMFALADNTAAAAYAQQLLHDP